MTKMTFFDVAKSLLSHDYTFAKSMPKNPHFYTLRKDWDDEEFMAVAEYIRKNGYEKRFYNKVYIYIAVNGYEYWTMGEPINKNGKPWTILINKAKINTHAQYDEIAADYDSLFVSEEAHKENTDIMDIINYKQGQSVLDIGCGTGLFLEYNKCNDYLGIDVSGEMLKGLKRKFDADVIQTPFEQFYTGKKFDRVISLFGAASYINPALLNRVKHFLKDEGEAILMFYKKDYYPETYKKLDVEFNHYEFEECKLDGEATIYNNYVIVKAVK